MTGSVCLYESSRNAARDRLRGKPATGINYDRWQARLDTPANYLPPVAPPVELDVHLHEDLAGSGAVAANGYFRKALQQSVIQYPALTKINVK
jgi:hypothetical protein